LPDYKEDADKFFPWENEEGRKKKPERGDSIPPNTSISSKLHSKPKNAGQEYLDMYIMSKEKARIEKYGQTLGKRQKNISTSWRKMKKELVKTEKELPKVPKGGIEEPEEELNTVVKQKAKIPGHMNKLNWNY